MRPAWREVARLSFMGQRFDGHALDVGALTEITRFQAMVARTAEVLWRAASPDRQRLPAHFEERTRLCLRRIEDASTAVPLEVAVEQPEQMELLEAGAGDAVDAATLIADVLAAIEAETPVPDRLPRSLLAEYEPWGQTLAPGEAIVLEVPGRTRTGTARVTTATRARLAELLEGRYEDHMDLTGEVWAADVEHQRSQMRLSDGHSLQLDFSAEHEEFVTTALRDHRTVRLHVTGWGHFSAAGKPVRVTRVDSLRAWPAGEAPLDPAAPPIEDVLRALADDVPAEEWDRLPDDLVDNLDHYLYGTPPR